jgi:hypothetical protein
MTHTRGGSDESLRLSTFRLPLVQRAWYDGVN